MTMRMEDRILILGQVGGTLFAAVFTSAQWTDIESGAKLMALAVTVFAGIMTGITGIYAIKRHRREIKKMDDDAKAE